MSFPMENSVQRTIIEVSDMAKTVPHDIIYRQMAVKKNMVLARIF